MNDNLISVLVPLVCGLSFGGVLGFVLGKNSEKCITESIRAKYEQLSLSFRSADEQLKAIGSKFEELNGCVYQYSNQKTRLESEKQALEKSLEDKEKQIQDKNKTIQELPNLFQREFENISNKLLATNSSNFKEESSKNLKLILEPLKGQIEQLEKQAKQFEDKAQQTIRENVGLKEQVKALTDQSIQVSKEAHNLAEALKGNKKLLGDWGEMILETLLENSGLVKDLHYICQSTIQNNDGKSQRPDYIINLPNGKQVIIDSKVSLNAYKQFCSCDDPNEQDIACKTHLDAIKKHINNLSAKNYFSSDSLNTPEIVLMFMPIEPAYILTIQRDPNILLECAKQNIVLASPSTVLAIAKTIATIWRQASQRKNVLEIAKEGGKLYDKFCGFINDFEKLESALKIVNTNFDSAKNKLFEGQRESIIKSCQKLKELGADATKQIPQTILTVGDE